MGESVGIAPADLMEEMKGKLDRIEKMLNEVSEKQRTRWILTGGMSGVGVFFGAGLGALIAGAGGNKTVLEWASIMLFVAAAAWMWYVLRLANVKKQETNSKQR